MFEDVDGSQWLGDNGELVHLTDTGATRYGSAQGMPKAFVSSIMRDARGVLLIGTRQSGIYALTDGSIIPLPGSASLHKSIITALCRDARGGIWIGTADKGLQYYDGKTITPCFSNPGIPPLQIKTLFVDGENNLWIGTHGDGLHRLRTSVVRYVKINEPGVAADVWAVMVQGETTWIGTRNSGIRSITHGIMKRPAMPPTLSTMTVGAFLSEPGGAMWIGGESGLFRKVGDKITEIKTPDGEPFTNAFAMVRDKNGCVWIGGQGLFKVSGMKVSKVEGMPSGISINYLFEDTKGSLWIGSDGNGVGHIEDNKITFYSVTSGLTSNTILCIYEDSQGGICAGTQGGGLNRFKNGRWGSVTEKNGLLDNFVNTIIRSHDGKMWMSTNRGLFGTTERALIDVTEGRKANLDGITIESRDGLQSTEFGGGLQNCSALADDGTLWFVSLKGLVGYHPRSVQDSVPAPPIYIESIEVNGHPVEFHNGMELEPGTKSIRFDYAALSYVVPTATKYKVYLEGYDDQWVNTQFQREATYTNLSPGVYTFHVTAASAEGPWNEHGAVVRIVILPFFWQTGVFKGFCFFILIGLAYGAYRLRVRQMLKTEEKLRYRIDEAIAKIKVLHGLIPICASCHKIRDDKGYWNDVSKYITQHTEAVLSHGICPDCAEELYGQEMKRIREKKNKDSSGIE